MKRGAGYWLKILATIPLLGMAAVLLLFAVGESTGGDYSGLFHAGPAMAAIGLIWLGWRYPTTGGWVSILLGGLAFLRYGLITGQTFGVAVLLMAVPPAVSGVLFLFAGRYAPQVNAATADAPVNKEF